MRNGILLMNLVLINAVEELAAVQPLRHALACKNGRICVERSRSGVTQYRYEMT